MSTTPTSREPQRIAKLLARAGIASRREIERMIAEGRIAKDGVVLDTPATILTSLQGVTVDGNPVKAPEPTRLFLYHKPSGLLTTERDPKGRPTIYDKLPRELPRVMPVGRLDLNTEGLLLLTTDGEFKRQLELPATGITRSYRARAYGNITQAQLEDLIDGIEIEGVRYGSIDANIERRTGANVWIELKLAEGKNREVRRVLEHFGLKVSRLIRTAYGPFVLGDVPSGGVDEVRQNDVFAFRKNMNLQAFSGGDDRTAHPQRSAPSRPSSPKPAPKPSRSRAEAPKPRPAHSRPSPPRSRPESADARPAQSKPGNEAVKAGPASPRPGKPPQKPGARRGASFNPRATGGRPPAAPSGGGGRGRRK